MCTLSKRHHAILNAFWSDARTARAFERLCDQLAPLVCEVLSDIVADERDTSPLGVPIACDDDQEAVAMEGVTVLAVAWIGALAKSDFRRGPAYLSDIDQDLLPIAADLTELYSVGRDFGLGEESLRAVFRGMTEHRSRRLPLPREALRLLKAIGFFAKIRAPEVDVEVPADIKDALETGDRAIVWGYGIGYVMLCEGDGRCHIERITPTVVDDIGDEACLAPQRVWERELVGSFILSGVQPHKAMQFAMASFRIFLSQVNLGYMEPQMI